MGFRKVTLGALTDLGPFDRLDSDVTGYGVRGAVGYVFPTGTFDPMFGINARVAIGGSYIDADGTSAADTTVTDNTMYPLLLSGAGTPTAFGFNCSAGAGLTCSTQSELDTDYRNWEVNGKLATDYKNGLLTVTPALTVFGGNSQYDQGFNQDFTQRNLAGVVQNTGVYTARTTLDWDDVGARVGLSGSFALTRWLTLQAGGDIGFAYRQASFSGRDVESTTAVAVFSGAGAVSDDASETAFLANAEAGIVITPMPGILMRGFAGITWDSDVPSFSGPSFAGPISAPTSVKPAALRFEDETSYYAGGRVGVKF